MSVVKFPGERQEQLVQLDCLMSEITSLLDVLVLVDQNAPKKNLRTWLNMIVTMHGLLSVNAARASAIVQAMHVGQQRSMG